MRLTLIRPSFEYAEQVMQYKESTLLCGDNLDGCAGLEEVNSFSEWIDFENRLKQKYGDGYVPSKVFLCVRMGFSLGFKVPITCSNMELANSALVVDVFRVTVEHL